MTTSMPIKAKVMIGIVAAASLCALSMGMLKWQAQAWPQFALLLAAAIISSRFKVKVPGMTSSMSANLPIILLTVSQLGLFSSLLVALTAAISQSYQPKSNPKPVQFLFNACTLMNATGLAYLAYHSRIPGSNNVAQTVSMTLAAATYFLANTFPVAGIIGLTEGANPAALWHKIFMWSFPNYVIGAGMTAIVATIGTFTALATLLSVLFAVHHSYKMYVGKAENMAAQPKAMAMAMSAGR